MPFISLIQFTGLPQQDGDLLVVLMVLVGVFQALFWMWLAWRAVCAHERLAEATDRAAGAPQDSRIA